MNLIKLSRFLSIFLFFSLSATAQDTLNLTREQAEAIFLKENLLLMAERLNIARSEARAKQAKLWPNPTFTLEQVNFWATPAQTGGQEVIPPLGGIRANQQFGFELEQLILTAGKRKKLMALEQVTIEQSGQYFEDLLRNLKTEFRRQLTHLQYLQLSKTIYQTQLSSVSQLTQAYRNQVELGHVPKGEFIRLKALELEIAKDISELNNEINEVQKELKLLMRLPSASRLQIAPEGYLKNTEAFQTFALGDLIDEAKAARPDFKLAQLEQTYYEKLYPYEKAQRSPNLYLKTAYDRGGNALLDFVGFGVAIDLPVFNMNQGNIKAAKIGKEKSEALFRQMDLSIENEVVLAYQNLSNAIRFQNQIEPGYEATLDELLTSYTRNFTHRNISLLEYLDFLDAYLENKKIILKAGKDVNEKAEELNYTVGKDVIN